MTLFPHGKLNLGLRVLAKRADGFHAIESGFVPIPFYDVLEIVPAETLSLSVYGIKLPGDAGDNLCLKAYAALKKSFPELPGVAIHLYKHIPAGAGLGGGSSDGAHTLTGLNELFALGLTKSQLSEHAGALGSDCPFFVQPNAALVSGRGEILEPLSINLTSYSLMLVHPSTHVSTAWAYSQVQPGIPAQSLRSILSMPVLAWKDELINDFERPVFQAHPELARIRQSLYDAGALYACMSGSGSTLFGLFEKGKIPAVDIDPSIPTTILN